MKDPHAAHEPDNLHAALASVSEELLAILSQLQAFSELPALQAAASQARTVAANMLVLFRQEMFEHHADEEREVLHQQRGSRLSQRASESDIAQGGAIAAARRYQKNSLSRIGCLG